MTTAAAPVQPGPDAGGMTGVRQARVELGEELVRRREKAGYSQTELARAVGIGRSTLFDSESARRLGSAGLWRRIDEVLGAGGALQQRRDQIAAMSTAAAEAEVRHGRRAPGGRPLSGSVAGGPEDPIVAARPCPSCGGQLIIQVDLRQVIPSRSVSLALTRPPETPRWRAPQARRRAGRSVLAVPRAAARG